MLKLKPIFKDYIWGGYKLKDVFGRDNNGKRISESWEVSVHKAGLSTSEQGTLKEYIDNNPTCVSKNHAEFPILIKYIDAAQNASIQVHPDDDYARKMEADSGKTEMWYVIQADEGAGIYCGFKKDVTKEEVAEAISKGEIEKLLNFFTVKAGDCFLIEAGTIHSIGAGCVMLEVQQSSDVTYRVFDYDRKTEDGKARLLNVERALDVIDYKAFVNKANYSDFVDINNSRIRTLTKCEYFCCRELALNGEFTEVNDLSFVAVNVISGKGMINGQYFTSGDSFFINRTERINIQGKAKIILTSASDI